MCRCVNSQGLSDTKSPSSCFYLLTGESLRVTDKGSFGSLEHEGLRKIFYLKMFFLLKPKMAPLTVQSSEVGLARSGQALVNCQHSRLGTGLASSTSGLVSFIRPLPDAFCILSFC